MDIGARIRKRREELNMTQEELAKKLGYANRSSVNKVETSREVSMKKINAYAIALETTVPDLMGWMDNKDAIEAATIDAELTDMSKEVKGYALKLSKMSDENQKLVFQMIDKLS